MAIVKLNTGIVRSVSGHPENLRMALSRAPFSCLPSDQQSTVTRRMKVSKPAQHPYRKAKKRLPDPDRSHWYQGRRCECMAYAIADYLWIHGHVDHNLWSRAVKAGGFSGYALWIKEATACARQGLYYPDVPSISGGYSTSKIIPGHTFQPPADCLASCPPSVAVHSWIAHNAPYATPWRWSINPIVIPFDWPGHDIISITYRWHWNPIDPTAYIEAVTPPLYPSLYSPLWPAQCATLFRTIYELTPGIFLTYVAGGDPPQSPFILEGIDQAPYLSHLDQGDWR